jgi:basic membrane lipoprotein Med (substrate-binding protein (PBP1-ABC) superfamily)
MRIRTLFVLVMVVALLMGCTGVAPATSVAPAAGGDAPAAEPLRIAVVMPSATNDLAFSQSMWEALKAVQAEMGGESAMELKYSENMFKVADAGAALREYASQGFDIVIGHGSQYGSLIQEVAPDFPDTVFAWGTDVNTFGLDNVYAYTPAAEQGGYVNGVLAARLTKTKTIGVTGPVEVGDAKTYIDGFVQGVASVDPSIKVNQSWTNSFSDVALMTEAAKTHIAAGADILTGSSQSVVGSVNAAKEAGNVLWLGTQSDQVSLAPENVVASQVYDWTNILKQIIENRQNGKLGGETFTLKLENDGLRMAFNSGYQLPDDVKQAAEAAIEGIKSGSITVEP